MLREIFLTNFGRFRDAAFALHPATVFHGPNEAGKTTIFDAIFFALCHPPANRRAGKLLRERYGPDADARLIFQSESVEVDEEEFRNLFAVRAGDVAAELSGNTRWIERVRANLFAGGLDPRDLGARLRKQTRTGANLTHNKQRQKLVSEREQAAARLEELRARRETILGGEQRLKELRRGLVTAEERLLAAREGLVEINAELKRQESARDRQLQEGLLSDIEQTLELEGRLASSRPPRAEDIQEYDRLAGEENRLARLVESLDEQIESERTALTAAEEETRRRGGELRLYRAMRAEAALARDRLREVKTTAWRVETIWRPLPIAGGVLGLVGAGAFAWFLPETLGYILAGACALAGIAGLLFARRVISQPDDAARARFNARLRNEWNRRFSVAGGEPMPAGDDELDIYFSRIETRCEQLEASLQADEEQKHAAEARIAEMRARRETSGTENAALKEASRALLGAHQVADRDALLLLHNDFGSLRARRDGLNEKIARRFPDAQLDTLRREARRKLEAYDEAGVPALPMAEAALRALRGRQKEAEGRIRDLEERERRGQIESEGLSREMSGSLQGLPAEIVELEARLGELDAGIAALDLDREAAGLAADLFDELAADTELALGELARDLGELHAEMRAGSEAGKGLRLGDLELKNVLLEDAGGELRALDHCSTGTRDAFLLAARLVLARKTRPDVRLLVLDEPFLSLDAAREREVLEFLAAFQAEHDWQFVFFTKEARLRQAILEVFPDAAAHEPAGTLREIPAGENLEKPTEKIAALPRKKAQGRKAGGDDDQAGLFAEL